VSFDPVTVSRQIRHLGTDMAMPTIAASAGVYLPFQEREPYQGVRIVRDASYGPHGRHRLDVFVPEQAASGARPVVLFVHGGGFVAGDKRQPGSPYNDNVALWAARNGLIGANMTYRLAPEFPWPSGAQDVAAAVVWLRSHIGSHGGDPRRIILLGTSAGAVHAASYIAFPEFHPTGGAGVAGGVLLSGKYDLQKGEPNEYDRAYFGADRSRYGKLAALPGLVATKVPLLFVLTELDADPFHEQGLVLVNAWFARHGRWPHFLCLEGHNHFTSTMHLNSPDNYLGKRILDFLDSTTPA
jgi:triacylglycerol lipase